MNNFSTSARCKFRINEESWTCSSDICPNQGQELQVNECFDLLVDISDHTGTLQSCNLVGTVAEKTLGCKVSTSNAYIKSGEEKKHLNVIIHSKSVS